MGTIERVEYEGLPGCVRLSNGTAEVVVSTQGGVRVLRYGRVGGANVFGSHPTLALDTPWGAWRPIGGHRLWAAPEAMPRSYAPDDAPAEYERVGDDTVLVRSPEDRAGIAKSLRVSLAASGTEVIVSHALANEGCWTVEVAPWALTILRGGGTVIIPQERRASHAERLDAARALALWSYTDMRDPRWTFGARYVLLRADPSRHAPQKVGAANHRGWCGYLRGETLFVKRHVHRVGAAYPDFGCSVEAYAAGDFVELETLGPLQRVPPGGACDAHEERWSLRAVAPAREGADPEDVVDEAIIDLEVD